MIENSAEKPDGLPEKESTDPEQEALKEKLLTQVQAAETIEDFARIKKESLGLDIEGGFKVVKTAIDQRFQDLIRDKALELNS